MPRFVVEFATSTPNSEYLIRALGALDNDTRTEPASGRVRVQLQTSGRALFRVVSEHPDVALDIMTLTMGRSRLRRARRGNFIQPSVLFCTEATAQRTEMFVRGDPRARGVFLADLHHLVGRGEDIPPLVRIRRLGVHSGRCGEDVYLVTTETPEIQLLLDLAEAYADLRFAVVTPSQSAR